MKLNPVKEQNNLESLAIKSSKKRHLDEWMKQNDDEEEEKSCLSEYQDQICDLPSQQPTVLDIFEHGSSISGDATSVYFSNGQEMISDNTSLHQWKPDYNLRREEYWDRVMMKFSCARGSDADSDPLSVNKEIVKEL